MHSSFQKLHLVPILLHPGLAFDFVMTINDEYSEISVIRPRQDPKIWT